MCIPKNSYPSCSNSAHHLQEYSLCVHQQNKGGKIRVSALNESQLSTIILTLIADVGVLYIE